MISLAKLFFKKAGLTALIVGLFVTAGLAQTNLAGISGKVTGPGGARKL